MSKNKGVILYPQHLKAMSVLTREEKGEIFEAITAYVTENKDISVSSRCVVIWELIRSEIQNNTERYNEKCEKMKANARRRHEQAKASNCNQKHVNNNNTNDNEKNKKEKEKQEKEKEKNNLDVRAMRLYDRFIQIFKVRLNARHENTKTYQNRLAKIKKLCVGKGALTDDQFENLYQSARADAWWERKSGYEKFDFFAHIHRSDQIDKYLEPLVATDQTLHDIDFFGNEIPENQSGQQLLTEQSNNNYLERLRTLDNLK